MKKQKYILKDVESGSFDDVTTDDFYLLVDDSEEVPSGGGTALETTYDNSDSTLSADNVKAALDELDGKVNKSFIDKFGIVEIPNNFNTTFNNLLINRKVGSTAELLNITSQSLRKFYPSPIEIFIDPIDGSDSNDGSDWDNAILSLNSTVLETGDRFYVRGNSNLATSFYINRDIEVIALDGKVNHFRGITGDVRTWTDEGDGVWSNVMTFNTPKLFDSRYVDERGELKEFEKVNDLPTVIATNNSYYKDGASNKLYIKTIDGLAPNTNNVMILTNSDRHSPGILATHLYFENINFVNGMRQTATQAELYVFKSCKFTNSDSDGFTAYAGNVKLFFENCIATKNFRDGFKYKDDVSAIEVNCVGNYNGVGNTISINNGSTGQDNSIQLRIGGVYHNNEGRQVHDLNNSKSLNIDCIAYNSISTDTETRDAFAIGADNISSETSEMWLDGCATKTDDGTYGAISITSYGNIYARNSNINNIKPDTTLINY